MLIGGVITAAFGLLFLLVFYLFGADRPVIRDLPPVVPAGISLVLLMTGGLLDLLGFLMRRSSPK